MLEMYGKIGALSREIENQMGILELKNNIIENLELKKYSI